jgi:Uma2 family endonuclease
MTQATFILLGRQAAGQRVRSRLSAWQQTACHNQTTDILETCAMQPDLIDPELRLPTSEELPCSDDTPVDNEYQNTIPNWLLAVLERIWGNRQDWFFGVDMGIYDREAQQKRSPAVVPDGFLSVGVQRHKRSGKGRLSYVLQEENEVVPLLALEFVSKTYGQEYGEKMNDYAGLGVKYYVIYNPEYSRRNRHEPFEVYQFVNGRYQLQRGEPFWIPEIELGIGRVQGELGGILQEWLAWHDETGRPYPLPQELIQRQAEQLEQERQRAEAERQRAEQTEQALEQERQRAEQTEQALEQERQRAEQTEQALEQERQRAEQTEQALEQERQRAEQTEQALEQERQRAEQERLEKLRLLERLRQLGVDDDQL